MQVAVIRAGLPEQDKRRREEMRFIHNFRTLAQGELNQDFPFMWLARAHTRWFLRTHFQILRYNELTYFAWWRQHAFAVSSNLSNSVNVAVCFSMISINKQHAINGERFATLYTIEGEKPARTAVQTVADSNVTIIFHF